MAGLISDNRYWLTYFNADETRQEHGLLYSQMLYDDGVRDCTLLATGQRFVGTGWRDSLTTLWRLYKAADEWLELMYGYQSTNRGIKQAYIGEPQVHVSDLPVCGHEKFGELEEDEL